MDCILYVSSQNAIINFYALPYFSSKLDIEFVVLIALEHFHLLWIPVLRAILLFPCFFAYVSFDWIFIWDNIQYVVCDLYRDMR